MEAEYVILDKVDAIKAKRQKRQAQSKSFARPAAEFFIRQSSFSGKSSAGSGRGITIKITPT